MTDRKLMQQALDALEWCYDVTEWPANGNSPQDKAIEALRARLAQPEPEPVAWISAEETWLVPKLVISDTPKDGYKPVYTAPPQREWQGLTDEEGYAIFEEARHGSDRPIGVLRGIRAIEAKLKAKNG